MSRRVVHLTSVHRPADTRIFERECRTLAGGGYDVTLVASGTGAAPADPDVQVNLVPPPATRTGRFLRTAPAVFRRARSLGADVYHFHDPELLPFGLALRRRGARVVYDAHEDYGREILGKEWIPDRLRSAVARATSAVERLVVRHLDLVVAATPTIARRFPQDRTVLVQNFPALDELTGSASQPYRDRPAQVTYVGDITVVRGAREMVEAMAGVATPGASLAVGGRFSPPSLRAELEALPGWDKVAFLGWLDRSAVAGVLGRSRAGLVMFHPTPAHLDAQPNKLFEYMAAGLPVVVSDFPSWRRLVETERCGLPVDPTDPNAVAGAVTWLLEHPEEAQEMGQRGRWAVEARYNWAHEGARLLEAYDRLN